MSAKRPIDSTSRNIASTSFGEAPAEKKPCIVNYKIDEGVFKDDCTVGNSSKESNVASDKDSNMTFGQRLNNKGLEPTGITPLGKAVIFELLDVVKAIVQIAPECVNVRDASGNTAMHYAMASSNMTIIDALFKVDGIDLNIFNNMGQKPIAGLMNGKLQMHCVSLKKE